MFSGLLKREFYAESHLQSRYILKVYGFFYVSELREIFTTLINIIYFFIWIVFKIWHEVRWFFNPIAA